MTEKEKEEGNCGKREHINLEKVKLRKKMNKESGRRENGGEKKRVAGNGRKAKRDEKQEHA